MTSYTFETKSVCSQIAETTSESVAQTAELNENNEAGNDVLNVGSQPNGLKQFMSHFNIIVSKYLHAQNLRNWQTWCTNDILSATNSFATNFQLNQVFGFQ
jgi:hypothetical protein